MPLFSGCILPVLETLPKFGTSWHPKEAVWTPYWRMSSAAKMSYSTSQQPQLPPTPASVVSSTESSSTNVEVENRLFPRCASTTTNTSSFQKTNSSASTVKKKTKKKKSATSTSSGAGTKTTKKVLKWSFGGGRVYTFVQCSKIWRKKCYIWGNRVDWSAHCLIGLN